MLEVTRVSFAYEVPADQFIAMTRDDEADERMMKGLDKLDCINIEYNGHFGNYIYFTLNAENDSEEQRKKITDFIDSELSVFA